MLDARLARERSGLDEPPAAKSHLSSKIQQTSDMPLYILC